MAGFCRAMENGSVSQVALAPYASQVTSRRCMRLLMTFIDQGHPLNELS